MNVFEEMFGTGLSHVTGINTNSVNTTQLPVALEQQMNTTHNSLKYNQYQNNKKGSTMLNNSASYVTNITKE